MIEPKAFVFIGRSGCGKGTQADLLIKKLKEIDPTRDVLYIQTGQEFRKFIQGSSLTAQKSKEYYDSDKIQPEFLAIRMWVDILTENYKGNEHIIFDGTPRKLHEAKVLDSVFDFYGFAKPIIFDIDISKEEATKRLLGRKRQDDKLDDIKKRLEWYEADVVPTIDWYRTNSRYSFNKIDGERSIEDIYADIVKVANLL